MDVNTIEVIERGMKCLSDNLGADETEVFISTILRERFSLKAIRRVSSKRVRKEPYYAIYINKD